MSGPHSFIKNLDLRKLELICQMFPFPDVGNADEDGLLAIGGDLLAERLISAYAQGIFPWYSYAPILWHSPDPRMVLFLENFKIHRSLRKTLRKDQFEIRFDADFAGVIAACRDVRAHEGTWITQEMTEAYINLFDLGLAHSIESYFEGKLVGGLYGVSLGKAFFGESMFFFRPEASKVALCALVEQLKAHDFDFIDCQVYTDNMARFGARLIDRNEFLAYLSQTLKKPTEQGSWQNWL